MEVDALDAGLDPVDTARRAAEAAEERWEKAAAALHKRRVEAAGPFAEAVSDRLASLGLGAGEFAAELGDGDPGQTGRDAVSFLVRPNPGMPLAPAAQTASGGELSRIALAIAAVAGGDTMVFDEIDAGIGGQTAHCSRSSRARRRWSRSRTCRRSRAGRSDTSASRRCRATRRTRGSSSSTMLRVARSLNVCSAAESL